MKISDLKMLYWLIEITIMARRNARKAKKEAKKISKTGKSEKN